MFTMCTFPYLNYSKRDNLQVTLYISVSRAWERIRIVQNGNLSLSICEILKGP